MIEEGTNVNSTDLHGLLLQLLENQHKIAEDVKRFQAPPSANGMNYLVSMREIKETNDVNSTKLKEFFLNVKMHYERGDKESQTRNNTEVQQLLLYIFASEWKIYNSKDDKEKTRRTFVELLDILEACISLLTSHGATFHESRIRPIIAEVMQIIMKIITLVESLRSDHQLKKQIYAISRDISGIVGDSLLQYLGSLLPQVLNNPNSSSTKLSYSIENINFETFQYLPAEVQVNILSEVSNQCKALQTYDEMVQICQSLGNIKNNWVVASIYIQSVHRCIVRIMNTLATSNQVVDCKKLLHALIFGDGRVVGLIELWKHSNHKKNYLFSKTNQGMNCLSTAASLSSFLQSVLCCNISSILENLQSVTVERLMNTTLELQQRYERDENIVLESLEVDVSTTLLQVEDVLKRVNQTVKVFKETQCQIYAVIEYLQVIQQTLYSFGTSYFFSTRAEYRQALLSEIYFQPEVSMKECINMIHDFHEEHQYSIPTSDDVGFETLMPLNILSSIIFILQHHLKASVKKWDHEVFSISKDIIEQLHVVRSHFFQWRQNVVLQGESLTESQETSPTYPDTTAMMKNIPNPYHECSAVMVKCAKKWLQLHQTMNQQLGFFQLTGTVLNELEVQSSFLLQYASNDPVIKNTTLYTEACFVHLDKTDDGQYPGWYKTIAEWWLCNHTNPAAISALATHMKPIFLGLTDHQYLVEEASIDVIVEVIGKGEDLLHELEKHESEEIHELVLNMIHSLEWCVAKSIVSNSALRNKQQQHRVRSRISTTALKKYWTVIEDESVSTLQVPLIQQDGLKTLVKQSRSIVMQSQDTTGIAEVLKILIDLLTKQGDVITDNYLQTLECYPRIRSTTIQNLSIQFEYLKSVLHHNHEEILRLMKGEVQQVSSSTPVAEGVGNQQQQVDVAQQPIVGQDVPRESEELKTFVESLLQEIFHNKDTSSTLPQQPQQANEDLPVEKVQQQEDIDGSKENPVVAIQPTIDLVELLDPKFQEQTYRFDEIEEKVLETIKQVEAKIDFTNVVTKEDVGIMMTSLLTQLNQSLPKMIEDTLRAHSSKDSSSALPTLKDDWCVQLSEMFNDYMMQHFKDDPDIIEDGEYFNIDVKKIQKLMKKIATVLATKISNYSKHLSGKMTELVLFHNNTLMPRVDFIDQEVQKLAGKVNQLIVAVSRKQYDRLATPKSSNNKSTDDLLPDSFRPSTSLLATSQSSAEVRVRPTTPTFSRADRFYKSKQQQDIETEMTFVLERKYIGEGSPYARKMRETVQENRHS